MQKIKKRDAFEQYTEDYTKYALYVIRARVAPDIKDGLKVIHRRILYGGYALSKAYANNYVKSSDWYGTVMGKLHPHGDSSIYGAMKGMTNWFDINIPLIDGQGSLGSVQGDRPSAGRYTEECLSEFAVEAVLGDVKEIPQTINWIDTYTGKGKEPEALAPKVPLLLINGTFGIGVGIKPFIPTHNINEVIDATLKLLDNPNQEIVLVPDQLMDCDIIDTDFKAISNTGYGKFRVRGRIKKIESIESSLIPNKEYIGKPGLLITSTPNLVNLNSITTQLEKGVKSGKIKLPQIIDLLEPEGKKKKKKKKKESTKKREKMEFLIILKKGSDLDYVRDTLYKVTDLEKTFTVNAQVLDNYEPIRISYRGYLLAFIENTKLTKFRYYSNLRQKVRTKIHQKDAYIKALESGKIDQIIKRIRHQKDVSQEENVEWLIKELGISDFQANFILNSTIKSLSEGYLNLYKKEAENYRQQDKEYLAKMLNEDLLIEEIKQDLLYFKNKYGRPRNSKVISASVLNKIPEGNFKIAITEKNFIKKVPENMSLGSFRNDRVTHVIKGENSNNLILFDQLGKVFKLPIYKIPISDKNSNGIDIRLIMKKFTSNLVSIFYEPVLKKFSTSKVKHFMTIQTKNCCIKKIEIEDILGCGISGIFYCKLGDGDYVNDVIMVGNGLDIITFSDNKALRMNISEIPTQTRSTKGVKSMDSDYIDGLSMIGPNKNDIIVITNNGYINRFDAVSFVASNRAKAGSRVIRLKSKDTIKYVFGVNDEDVLRVVTKNDITEIPITEIPKNSSASGGSKMITVNNSNLLLNCKIIHNK